MTYNFTLVLYSERKSSKQDPQLLTAFLLTKRQKANSLENITWSVLGKQNIQAKKVYRNIRHSSVSSQFSQTPQSSIFKNTLLQVVFSVLFSVFDLVKKHRVYNA